MVSIAYELTTLSHEALWELQRGRCFYCERVMYATNPPNSRVPPACTRDHFWPRSSGLPAFYVLACHACNNAKADRMPTTAEAERFLALYQRGHKAMPRFALPMEKCA